MTEAFKATTARGESCHFGYEPLARAWAGEGGTVERIEIRDRPTLSAVRAEPASTQDQDRRAQRLAMAVRELKIEATHITPDYTQGWNDAVETIAVMVARHLRTPGVSGTLEGPKA